MGTVDSWKQKTQTLYPFWPQAVEVAKKTFERLQLAEPPKELLRAQEVGGIAAVTASEGMLVSVLTDEKASDAVKKKKVETLMATTIGYHASLFNFAVKKHLHPGLHAHAMAFTLKSGT